MGAYNFTTYIIAEKAGNDKVFFGFSRRAWGEMGTSASAAPRIQEMPGLQ